MNYMHFPCAGCVEVSPPLLMSQELPLLVYTVLTYQLQTTDSLILLLQLVMVVNFHLAGIHKAEAVSLSSIAQ